MCSQRANLVWIVLVAGVITGCDPAPSPTSGTGAREAAKRYCDALFEKDWARAYAALHPDSRARYSASRFVHLAERYRRDLGFEPEPARIRFCQEQGTRAVAHIVWKSQKSAHEHFYKDVMILRSSQAGWKMVLPQNFGSGRLR
jgi:hypothetical protein